LKTERRNGFEKASLKRGHKDREVGKEKQGTGGERSQKRGMNGREEGYLIGVLRIIWKELGQRKDQSQHPKRAKKRFLLRNAI